LSHNLRGDDNVEIKVIDINGEVLTRL